MSGDFTDFSDLTFHFTKSKDDYERLLLCALHMASSALQTGMAGLLEPAQALADMAEAVGTDLLERRPGIEISMETFRAGMVEATEGIVLSARGKFNLNSDQMRQVQTHVIDSIFQIVRGEADLLDLLLSIHHEAGE